MSRSALAKLRSSIGLAAFALAGAWGADGQPARTRLIPDNAIAVLEVKDPKLILDPLLSPSIEEIVTSLEAYRRAIAQPKTKEFLGVIRFLEARFGADWRTILRRSLSGGLAWSMGPDGLSILIVDAASADFLKDIHGVFHGLALSEALKQGVENRISSQEYRGETVWTLGDDEAHVLLGNRLLLSNRAEGVKAALDRRAAPAAAACVADLPPFKAASAGLGDAAATIFVNAALIKQNPQVAAGLATRGNPLAELLFSAFTEVARQSTWIVLGLRIEGQTVILDARADGSLPPSSDPLAFTWPPGRDRGALPNVMVPRRIAAASLYRDLPTFYAAKDELFPERTSGLIFFENMMGIFFTGRNITDEIMAELGPEIRFVVAEQAWDPSIGKAQVKLPAFAAILRLRNPEEFGAVVEEAWQKAIGLFNFTRGQQALPGLIIDRAVHGETRFTVSYFRVSSNDDREALPQRFNFRPALAQVGNWLILSSAEGLARDCIDALRIESSAPRPLAEAHSLFDIEGAHLASILQANRETLIRQNMIEKGNDREEAETQVATLILAAQCLDRARLTAGSRDGRPMARLSVTAKPPPVAAP